MNYGQVGAFAGHEITHGFDDKGRMFDQKGNLKNWWTESTAATYKQRGECLVKQYSSMIEPVTGVRVSTN